MDDVTSSAAPIACTLDSGDFKERLTWITDLNRGALLGSRRDGLRLELTYASQALEDVRDLKRREAQCCAFLDFDLRVEVNAVRLVVTAPETAREAADLVFESFQSKDTAASPHVSADCRTAGGRCRSLAPLKRRTSSASRA